MIKLTKEEYEIHKNQKVCSIYNNEFSAYDGDKNYYKVKNYCKFSGKYIESCHKICKVKLNSLKEIPIIFINFQKTIFSRANLFKSNKCSIRFINRQSNVINDKRWGKSRNNKSN